MIKTLTNATRPLCQTYVAERKFHSSQAVLNGEKRQFNGMRINRSKHVFLRDIWQNRRWHKNALLLKFHIFMPVHDNIFSKFYIFTWYLSSNIYCQRLVSSETGLRALAHAGGEVRTLGSRLFQYFALN